MTHTSPWLYWVRNLRNGNIIEGDFLTFSTHFETDAISFYLFNLVGFLSVSTYGIMFEQAKVGICFKTNYWFFIPVHVCYGLEAAKNRIFKSKEGNNMKGEYPFSPSKYWSLMFLFVFFM